MHTLYAVMPCYNEQDNISGLIEKWLAQREDLLARGYALRVAAIDDHSTDQTRAIIQALADRYEEVQLLAHPENRGLCGGLNTAISFFAENGAPGDLLALMDGDNTQDPCYIHAMVARLEGGGQPLDCVIASRYCTGSATRGVPRHRVLFSDMARYYYRWLLRVPGVEDYTCGYRVYTYAILQRLLARFGEDPIQEKTFACMMELLYKLYLVGARFGEVPFALRYDLKQGRTKMSVLSTAVSSLSTAFTLRRIGKQGAHQ